MNDATATTKPPTDVDSFGGQKWAISITKPLAVNITAYSAIRCVS